MLVSDFVQTQTTKRLNILPTTARGHNDGEGLFVIIYILISLIKLINIFIDFYQY